MADVSKPTRIIRSRARLEAKHFVLPLGAALIAWFLWELVELVNSGIVVWLLLTPAVVSLLFGLVSVLNLGGILLFGRELVGRRGQMKLSVAVISLMLTLTLFEAFLTWQAATITYDPNDPAQSPAIPPLTMPKAWEKRPVSVKHAVQAYYWHGHLHALTAIGMRLLQPPLPKDPNACRILVVGDSFTYGVGVPEEATYCSKLQELLSKTFRVEVLNLGIPGKQSGDIRKIAEAYTRSLEPDLVVYGVCLNDYLPSGKGEHTELEQRVLPLPRFLRDVLLDKTRTCPFLARGFFSLAVALGLEKSFLSEIEDAIDANKSRFDEDMRYVNESVVRRGLPPVVAMVLVQSPRANSRLQKLVLSTEKTLEDAGMTVVSTDELFEHYDGQRMEVSHWDRHPNSTAHALFAQMLAKRISQLPLMERYRKDTPAAERSR